MKKPTKPKKKNMQDATLINVRAVNKRVARLAECLNYHKECIDYLEDRLLSFELSVAEEIERLRKKLEAKKK